MYDYLFFYIFLFIYSLNYKYLFNFYMICEYLKFNIITFISVNNYFSKQYYIIFFFKNIINLYIFNKLIFVKNTNNKLFLPNLYCIIQNNIHKDYILKLNFMFLNFLFINELKLFICKYLNIRKILLRYWVFINLILIRLPILFLLVYYFNFLGITFNYNILKCFLINFEILILFINFIILSRLIEY